MAISSEGGRKRKKDMQYIYTEERQFLGNEGESFPPPIESSSSIFKRSLGNIPAFTCGKRREAEFSLFLFFKVTQHFGWQ